jgi:tRNA(fMet)-specific endonuclease VapC
VRYVLDTNVVARLLDGDERVTARLAEVSTDEVGMPLVVFAELLFGAEKSARRDANLARLARFAADVEVLPFDRAVAARYAAVRAAVERGGRPKSDFDLVVACTALEHGATLVTHDGALKDGSVAGLVVDDLARRTVEGGGMKKALHALGYGACLRTCQTRAASTNGGSTIHGTYSPGRPAPPKTMVISAPHQPPKMKPQRKFRDLPSTVRSLTRGALAT